MRVSHYLNVHVKDLLVLEVESNASFPLPERTCLRFDSFGSIESNASFPFPATSIHRPIHIRFVMYSHA